MTALHAPIKDILRNTTTPASVARMWARIEARTRVRSSAVSKHWVALAAAATVLCVGALSFALYGRAVLHTSLAPPLPAPHPTLLRGSRSASRQNGRASPVPAPVTAPPQESIEERATSASGERVSNGTSPALKPVPSSAAAAHGISAWRELAKQGENEEAYAELGPRGVERVARSASVEDLLALADVARLSGHPRDAVEPLERIVTEHAGDPRASLAALTLGRVELRSLGEPALAAEAFEKAIALKIPGSLAEDAQALLAESRAKAGSTRAQRP